jgi:hypothetical protein
LIITIVYSTYSVFYTSNAAENLNELINSELYSVVYLILTQGNFQRFLEGKLSLTFDTSSYAKYKEGSVGYLKDIMKNVYSLPKATLLNLETESYMLFYCTDLTMQAYTRDVLRIYLRQKCAKKFEHYFSKIIYLKFKIN